MAFAEIALAQIKSLRQSAIPRNYEIWYVYATGYNSQLNKIINETLTRNGKLTEADLEQIYETYLSQIKTTDRIDKVGARDRRNRRCDEPHHRSPFSVGAVRREPVRRHPKARSCREPRPGQDGRRNAGEIHPRDARYQQGARRPADAVEIRNQQPAAEPGGDPRRKPDRSADRSRQPQIFRPLDRYGGPDRARERRAAVTADVRHRPFQIVQRQLWPPHRRSD